MDSQHRRMFFLILDLDILLKLEAEISQEKEMKEDLLVCQQLEMIWEDLVKDL